VNTSGTSSQTGPRPESLDIFVVVIPGLEEIAAAEARERGIDIEAVVPGGIVARGDWTTVWRANLVLRCASRILVRLASFPARDPAELDRALGQIDWSDVLRPGILTRVDATVHKSRLRHSGMVADRVTQAAARVTGKVGTTPAARLFVRLERDHCTISIDSSGAPLHKRGFKQAVATAPLRETMAAAFLRACDYRPTEGLVDPMCGSGTIPIEAAEIAAGLWPGRSRAFAFEQLATFDPAHWAELKAMPGPETANGPIHASDRSRKALDAAAANAARAGISDRITFHTAPVLRLQGTDAPSGLVLVNPPYGERIGEHGPLRSLHATLGRVLRERYRGWRVGLVSSDPTLVAATGLAIAPATPPVPHGGLDVRLYRGEIP
jgi:putative N6-adenine-specific DNA methylase